jgi:isoleucyl-tRNA synthetase
MTKLKDKLIENNNGVDWYPDYVGEKRFGNWLENLNDWAISRSRYWGTPLPIWTCECGHTESVGSREELKERALEEISEDIELHRPFVDDVHLECPKCGEKMERVPDVIDCWFDSGSMPFAQHHYPFENKENFDELFPADFICEGIDQTRGWFYSLIAISTFVTGESPYKKVLVNDLILDKHGKKMSKSRGNTVNPFELFDQYGADALRWYLLYVSPAWTPTKFDEDGLKEVLSKFFGTIKNVYTFFSLYANTDEVDPREFEVDYDKRPELDRWIISKLNNLIKLSRESMDEYDLTKVVRGIQDFVNEDLSNWYIRRSRRRFWASGLSDDKKSVYATTYEVLRDLSLLIAPYAPYIAEELYRKLTDKKSVHLDFYPEYDESLIDERTEKRMDLVRNLVGLGRASRDTEQIKVRQPLRKIHIDGKHEDLIKDLSPLIMEELNIKEVVFEKNLREFMNFSLKPNFRVAGPKFGNKVKDFAKALREADELEIINTVQNGGVYELELGGETIEVNEELLDIRIDSKEGYNISMENNLFVILDTNLDDELINEGYAREFISKVQQMRKNNGYEMMDNIKIFYKGPEEIEKAVKLYEDYIKTETLAVEIVKEERDDYKTENLNGKETGLKLEKIS